jgi:hypothetical protein
MASPLIKGGRRSIDFPTSHADLIPTLLDLAVSDQKEALKRVAMAHREARSLVGRDLSGPVLGTGAALVPEPVLFMTDDEFSEGHAKPKSPFQIWSHRLHACHAITELSLAG